jgi:hypothetical protein
LEIEVSYLWAVLEHCEIGRCSRHAMPDCGLYKKLLEELLLPAICRDYFL